MTVDFARQSYMRCPLCSSVVCAEDTRDDDSDFEENFAVIEKYVCEECDHAWEVGVRWKPDEEIDEDLPVYRREYAADNCLVCGEQMMVKDDAGAAYMYCTGFLECSTAVSLRVFLESSVKDLNIKLGYDETTSLPLDEKTWAWCLAQTIAHTVDYERKFGKKGCLVSMLGLFILGVLVLPVI